MAEDRAFLAETETIVPIVHPPGSGKVVGVGGGRSTFKVLSEQTGGANALLEQQVPPGQGLPLYVHRHETGIFYVLEGLFEITLGDRTVEAPPGALAVGPRDIPQRRPDTEQAAPDRHPGSILQPLPRVGRPSRRGPRHH